jgi:protein transport protein SEC9
MKKFSKKKTQKASKDDPNRSALFGTRKSPSPSYATSVKPSNRNPYARQNTYVDQQADPYTSQNDPYAQDPSISRTSTLTSPLSPPQPRPAGPSRGFSDDSQDSARNALFGNRLPPQPAPNTTDADRYEEYQRQTQDSDDDVEAIKQEIRFVKQDSLASTRNAIRIGLEAEEQGRNSLARLGDQSEKLSGVERGLDVSAANARIAEEKARELKKLRRSMFAVSMGNPFTAKSRAEEEEARIMARHELERMEREKNRREAYESTQRVNDALKPKYSKSGAKSGGGRSTITARSAYAFEEDDEDVEVERDINANLNTLGDITSRLKGLALATQGEIEAQNQKLDTIADKVLFIDVRLY